MKLEELPVLVKITLKQSGSASKQNTPSAVRAGDKPDSLSNIFASAEFVSEIKVPREHSNNLPPTFRLIQSSISVV